MQMNEVKQKRGPATSTLATSRNTSVLRSNKFGYGVEEMGSGLNDCRVATASVCNGEPPKQASRSRHSRWCRPCLFQLSSPLRLVHLRGRVASRQNVRSAPISHIVHLNVSDHFLTVTFYSYQNQQFFLVLWVLSNVWWLVILFVCYFFSNTMTTVMVFEYLSSVYEIALLGKCWQDC